MKIIPQNSDTSTGFLPIRHQSARTMYLNASDRRTVHELLTAACRAATRGREDVAVPLIEAACRMCREAGA